MMPKTNKSRTGKMMANSTAMAPRSPRMDRFVSDLNLRRIVFLAKPTNCTLSIRVPDSSQGDCSGCYVKKLNQSLIKFYPGIPDIGGQETCFLPVKRKKSAERQTGQLR
jgi:hypothetical protein